MNNCSLITGNHTNPSPKGKKKKKKHRSTDSIRNAVMQISRWETCKSMRYVNINMCINIEKNMDTDTVLEADGTILEVELI